MNLLTQNLKKGIIQNLGEWKGDSIIVANNIVNNVCKIQFILENYQPTNEEQLQKIETVQETINAIISDLEHDTISHWKWNWLSLAVLHSRIQELYNMIQLTIVEQQNDVFEVKYIIESINNIIYH